MIYWYLPLISARPQSFNCKSLYPRISWKNPKYSQFQSNSIEPNYNNITEVKIVPVNASGIALKIKFEQFKVDAI